LISVKLDSELLSEVLNLNIVDEKNINKKEISLKITEINR